MTVGLPSWSSSKIPNLKVFLNDDAIWQPFRLGKNISTLAGWGRKPKSLRALRHAQSLNLPFITLEDGFVRSVNRTDPPLSLIVDHLGVYFDANKESWLEQLIKRKLTASEVNRTRLLIELWKSHKVSKYNSFRDYEHNSSKPYVVVCDQVYGDSSVLFGRADEISFKKMLEAAIDEYPFHDIVVKTHPDTLVRRRKGYFSELSRGAFERIKIVSDPVHPYRVLELADAVYVVTSQLGFEALLLGKYVRCFGMPFYAGWGLTKDEQPSPPRRSDVSLFQLVHASLVKYPRYIDPLTQLRCEPEKVISHVGLQRRSQKQLPNKITAIGFSRWKRPFIRAFLAGSDVKFSKSIQALNQKASRDAVAFWGKFNSRKTGVGNKVLTIEDGFLRSFGLGADLIWPLSLVIDDIGIYYDCTQPSRLEIILQQIKLGPREVGRARKLKQDIIDLGLTKYNLAEESWAVPKTEKPILLVVGQVESDASVEFGSPIIKTNLELLKQVRKENPNAYIIFKTHPDVVAGLRARGEKENQYSIFSDEILNSQVSLNSLLPEISELHTMTSLMGFEALIRGAKVVCHGLPFYAGWGLTKDRIHCNRRSRKLSVDELVHGVLIDYPRYIDYKRSCFIEPEEAVHELKNRVQVELKSQILKKKFLRILVANGLKITRLGRV